MTTPSTDASLIPASAGPRGRFLWYDLMSPDTDASVAFYTAVAGWGTTQWEMAAGMPPYVMWTVGEATIGGTMSLPADEVAKGTRAHWIAYIGTPDCDATYEQALAAGATPCAPPRDIPTVGKYAVLKDPQGALFSIFTPAPTDAPPAPWAPSAGKFGWHELQTTEREPAFAFYQQLFGWESMQEMDMGPHGIYQIYGLDGVQLGGVYAYGPDTKPVWQLYVVVTDLDAAIEAVRAHGGEIVRGPNPVPGGRVAECRDPQGGAFALNMSDAQS